MNQEDRQPVEEVQEGGERAGEEEGEEGGGEEGREGIEEELV